MTPLNNGNKNLGNFSSEDIISASRKCFQENPDRTFHGNSHDSTTEFLSFIKAVLEFMPSTPEGRYVLSVIKKAMGAKFGVNIRNTTTNLYIYEDGGLMIYWEDYLAKQSQVYNTVVAQNASPWNNLRYPAILPYPFAAAGTPQVVGSLIGDSTWAMALLGLELALTGSPHHLLKLVQMLHRLLMKGSPF
jgi:hypothetical protein